MAAFKQGEDTTMTKDDAIATLERQRAIIAGLRGKNPDSPEFTKWKRDSEIAIEHAFGSGGRHCKDFGQIEYFPSSYNSANQAQAFAEAYARGLGKAGAVLASMIDELKEYGLPETAGASIGAGTADALARICARFPLVANQLLKRHQNRETLRVQDEYDAQDLLHALLRLHFDDVRPEELTPSYGGKAARGDFLIKNEQVFVEAKMTRPGHGSSEIRDELIIDTAHYKTHPACRKLVCFIFDPGHLIPNPAGLASDLGGKHDGLEVQVFIEPRLC
jgi:hypothetical protein